MIGYFKLSLKISFLCKMLCFTISQYKVLPMAPYNVINITHVLQPCLMENNISHQIRNLCTLSFITMYKHGLQTDQSKLLQNLKQGLMECISLINDQVYTVVTSSQSFTLGHGNSKSNVYLVISNEDTVMVQYKHNLDRELYSCQ